MFWVGASDQGGDDDIVWLEYERHVSAVFWAAGEPNHSNGDCVYLNAVSDLVRLVMFSCDVSLYPLCKV